MKFKNLEKQILKEEKEIQEISPNVKVHGIYNSELDAIIVNDSKPDDADFLDEIYRDRYVEI